MKYLISTILIFAGLSLSAQQNEYGNRPVDMGFGIQKSNTTSTAAISTINADKVMEGSALNVGNTLFGKLLGLTALQNAGFENSNDPTFFIRGEKSLSNNNILILIDGFERPLSNITLDEIESISVLKDAAAVALYGYKGVNGIVLVTTKRGVQQALDVKLSYDHSFVFPTKTPKMVDGLTYARAYNEARANDGLSPGYNIFEMDAFENNTYPYSYPNVDWKQETMRDMASTNRYNVSIRGGGAKVKFFTMLNLNGAQGLLKDAQRADYSSQLKYSQGNIRTNVDVDFTQSSKLQVNVNALFWEYNRPASLDGNEVLARYFQIPAAAFPVRFPNGNWGGDARWGSQNPVANIMASGYGKDHARSLYADAKFTQDLKIITKGLSGSIRFGYDNHANYWEKRATGFEYQSSRLIFDDFGLVTGEQIYTGGDKATDLKFSRDLNRQWRSSNFVATLDYKKEIGGHSNLMASLIYQNTSDVLNGQNNAYYRKSFTGYVSYDYKNRYVADLVLMYGGSNRFSFFPSRYAFSPTMSVAWVLSNEQFLSDSKAINFLKLRASAGILASDNVPTLNPFTQSFGGGGSFYFGDNYTSFSGTKENALASNDLTPERNFKYNIGLDGVFFNSLTLTADAYFQRTTDIILSQGNMNSAVLGVGSPYVNAGIVDSYGAEVGLNYHKTFGSWLVDAGVQYSFTRSKIVENLQGPVAYPHLDKRGNRVSQAYGLVADGFFANQAAVDSWPYYQSFSPVTAGDIRYKDINGDDIINSNDVVAMGYSTRVPEHYYSLNLGLEYKGIGFTAIFQGVANYTKFLTTAGVYRPMNNGVTVSEHYYANRWAPGKDNMTAQYPRLSTQDVANNNQNSTVWLKDMSYFKLRYCEAYYKLPAKLLTKVKMSNAKVFVRGTDLFSSDHIKISDPESTGSSYPITKSVNVGISLNF